MRLLLPLPSDRRSRRLVQLYAGLLLYGVSSAVMIEAHLGLNPWDVLHQGLARRTGISIGSWTIIVGVVVLLLWIPLRQRPGVGTISNALVIGIAVDGALAVIGSPDGFAARSGMLVAGIAANGVATGLYIGANLGPGPRDGLMTGLAARGGSIRVVRTGLEAGVLGLGWLLGGAVGIGTIAYALAIGPIAHVTIPLFTIGLAEPSLPPEGHSSIA